MSVASDMARGSRRSIRKLRSCVRFAAGLLVAASVTAMAWFFAMRARFGVAGLNSLRPAFLATLQVPELQRDALREFAVTFAAVSALLALSHEWPSSGPGFAG